MTGMDDDDTLKWVLVGVGLLYLYGKARSAVAAITKQVERFKNLGLTDEEDHKAQATIADPKASIADKRAAVATLRTKVATAKELTPAAVAHVRPLEKALDLYERELAGQDELAEKRRAWEAEQSSGKAN